MAIETSEQRSGGTEAERRRDGAGRPGDPLPGSEASRGNVEPRPDAPHGAEEVWTPAGGTRKTDPGASGPDGSDPGARAAVNRGAPASTGSGGVTGSGAGAGGGAPEDHDSDAQSGGGTMPQPSPAGGTGADAPSHGSR